MMVVHKTDCNLHLALKSMNYKRVIASMSTPILSCHYREMWKLELLQKMHLEKWLDILEDILSHLENPPSLKVESSTDFASEKESSPHRCIPQGPHYHSGFPHHPVLCSLRHPSR